MFRSSLAARVAAPCEINLIPTQCTQLRHSEPVSVCNKDHCRIAMPVATTLARTVQQVSDFLDSKIFTWPALGIFDPARRYCPINSVWRVCRLEDLTLEIRAAEFITVPRRSIFGTVYRNMSSSPSPLVIVEGAGGSSPRVWGTRHGYCHARRGRARSRFIPARAGNFSRVVCAKRTVHPRACGERPLEDIEDRRFIPARAGNTRQWRRLTPGPGSSPRVRGTPGSRVRARISVHPRACGEHWHRERKVSRAVHPRACGELTIKAGPSATGSSPRVRGTHFHMDSCSSVHPRACGEHVCGLAATELRFIPARAGNSRAAFNDHPPVHPRACGELVQQSRDISDSVHPRACGER